MGAWGNNLCVLSTRASAELRHDCNSGHCEDLDDPDDVRVRQVLHLKIEFNCFTNVMKLTNSCSHGLPTCLLYTRSRLFHLPCSLPFFFLSLPLPLTSHLSPLTSHSLSLSLSLSLTSHLSPRAGLPTPISGVPLSFPRSLSLFLFLCLWFTLSLSLTGVHSYVLIHCMCVSFSSPQLF